MAIRWKPEDFEPKTYCDLENPTFGLCAHIRSLRDRIYAVYPEDITIEVYMEARFDVDDMIFADLENFQEAAREDLKETGKKIRMGYGGLTEVGVLRDCYEAMKEGGWGEIKGLGSPATLFAVLAQKKLIEAERLLLSLDAPIEPDQDVFNNPAVTRYAFAGDAVAESLEAVNYAEYLLKREPRIGSSERLATQNAEPTPNVFAEYGTHWFISYEKEDIRLDKCSAGSLGGLFVMRELLRSRRPLPVDVYKLYYMMSAPTLSRGLLGDPPEDSDAIKAGVPGQHVDAMVDRTALIEYKKRCHVLREAIAEIEGRGTSEIRPDDGARLDELRKEQTFLFNEIRNSTSENGTIRTFPDDEKRCGRAVGAAMDRVFDVLLERHKPLHDYLRDALRDRHTSTPYYRDAGKVFWSCEPTEQDAPEH